MANFEDIFLDDLLKSLYSSRCAFPTCYYDEIWNASLRSSLRRVCAFFGREVPAEFSIASEPAPHEATEGHDPVNHPSYYCDGGIETLDYILAKNMDFLLGSVCKYISRAGKKDPAKELEDLKKARFYLDRKIKELENGLDNRL